MQISTLIATQEQLAAASAEELASILQAAEQKQRLLQATAEAKQQAIRKLRDGVRETVEVTEREEERMSNALLRRLEHLNGEHQSLKTHLASEHQTILALEAKLKGLASENSQLQETLLSEEQDIVRHLKLQIDALAKQKGEIEEKLTLELSEVQRHLARLQAGASRGIATDSAAELSSRSSSAAAALDSGVPITNASSASRDTPGRSTSVGSSNATPHSAGPNHRPAGLASDSSMSRLLQREIDRLRVLHADFTDRNIEYKSRISNLESRLDNAQLERERQRVVADRLRAELSQTISLTHEIIANHELYVEWQAERELLSSGSKDHPATRERPVSVLSEAAESQNDGTGDDTLATVLIRRTPFSDAPPAVLHGSHRVTARVQPAQSGELSSPAQFTSPSSSSTL